MNTLSRRHRVAEIMDDPGLPAAEHRLALAGLRRVERVSRTSAAIWRQLEPEMRAGSVRRVLDLGCGGGDVVIGLAERAARGARDLEVTGVDISDVAIEFARDAARRRGVVVDFARLDVVRDPLPRDYDAVLCSLFVHHLSDVQIRDLLRRMGRAARRVVIVDDLRRSWLGHAFAVVGTRLLSRSHVVHVDGPRSVRAALRAPELRDLAEEAGLRVRVLYRRWPQRMLMVAVPS